MLIAAALDELWITTSPKQKARREADYDCGIQYVPERVGESDRLSQQKANSAIHRFTARQTAIAPSFRIK